MMECEEVSQKITDYLEDKLPFGERVGIWIHLLMCEHCSRYYDQIQSVISYAGELDSDESNSLDDETKQTLKEKFQEQTEQKD